MNTYTTTCNKGHTYTVETIIRDGLSVQINVCPLCAQEVERLLGEEEKRRTIPPFKTFKG